LPNKDCQNRNSIHCPNLDTAVQFSAFQAQVPSFAIRITKYIDWLIGNDFKRRGAITIEVANLNGEEKRFSLNASKMLMKEAQKYYENIRYR
jgi:hypothetical protein